MAPEKEIDGDTMLLLHIIHKDNPTLSGGNWPAISAKMGQPAERIRKRFAAMRKEFLEMNPGAEAGPSRKRGRPAKNPKGGANGETKPKAKRAKTASAKNTADEPSGDEVASSSSDAVEGSVAAAPAKKPKGDEA